MQLKFVPWLFQATQHQSGSMLLVQSHFVGLFKRFLGIFLLTTFFPGSPWLHDTQKRVEMAQELEKWGKVTGWPVSIIAEALSPPSNTTH